ncbi:6-phosphogluconolactonase, cycloisomerase 2 family [Arthrobacter alpinus]|uniref:6-phosphogluconolactonase, cycloisomerase 2 family n=1 Tax=Arthrobacter alpinus TaxID=656366 RepID=A0A1H5K518_9MICC|nr:beta-propeller fold lactonase family protein [Arthrobacter alpinus]SEE59800.1 6-phosphogluconolactonase, cycloisomerase 2 family [Arthrobacter alpinus]
MPSIPSIFVSGYTEEGYGAGPGLVRFELLAHGLVGERRAESPTLVNPSFVIAGGGCLLAAEEGPHGNVVALDPLTLNVAGRVPTGGADSCHVALIEDQVWAANYSSGNASLVPLAGLLGSEPVSPRLLAHPGSGPVSDRQGESHAHQVTATPWGTALVSDLGADRVDEYALAGGRFELLGSAQLPPGAGPRHVALKGDFLLVAGELDGCVHVLQRTPRDGGSDYFWRWLSKTPLADSAQAVESAESFSPSHIELSHDGNQLYAAVRGPNTIVVLDVRGLQSHQSPRFLGAVSSGGNWPRHFALDTLNGKIYVANQLSNNVAVFELDELGIPGAKPIQSVDFGSPNCILIA